VFELVRNIDFQESYAHFSDRCAVSLDNPVMLFLGNAIYAIIHVIFASEMIFLEKK